VELRQRQHAIFTVTRRLWGHSRSVFRA